MHASCLSASQRESPGVGNRGLRPQLGVACGWSPRPGGLGWAGRGDCRGLPGGASAAPGVGRVPPRGGGACGVESNLEAQREAGSGAGGARSPSRRLSQSRAQAQPAGGGGNGAQGAGRSPPRPRRRRPGAARRLEAEPAARARRPAGAWGRSGGTRRRWSGAAPSATTARRAAGAAGAPAGAGLPSRGKG